MLCDIFGRKEVRVAFEP